MKRIIASVKNYEICSWMLLLVAFLYMLTVNYLMPLHRDDYWYSLIWNTPSKIRDWHDIFQSLYAHYLTHGGRMIAFLVLDSFLLIGKQWFNVFNALLFVALIILIYWHSQRTITLHFDPIILLLILFFSWLGIPHFAEVTIWMTGACVYLLSIVIILTFLLPYHFSLLEKPLWNDRFMIALFMFCFGVIAGWTIENTAGTMTLVTMMITYYSYKKNNLAKWMLFGCSGALTGYIFLIVAPGNYVRWNGIANPKFIYHLTNQIVAAGEMLQYVLPILIFIILCRRILIKKYYRQINLKIERKSNCESNKFSSFVRFFINIIILVMLLSYINDLFLSKWLSNLIYYNLIETSGFAGSELKLKFFNTMSGLEEMSIYLLLIRQLYYYIIKKLRLRQQDVRVSLPVQNMIALYPACYFTVAWLILAAANNLMMIASPQFPGRALIGSAVFLIIGAMSLLTIPDIYKFFSFKTRKKLLMILCGLIIVPMATAVLYQYIFIHREDSKRIAYIRMMSQHGVTVLAVEPIIIKNRILRHVYYDDLTEHLYVKPYICNYFGLQDLLIKDSKT